MMLKKENFNKLIKILRLHKIIMILINNKKNLNILIKNL